MTKPPEVCPPVQVLLLGASATPVAAARGGGAHHIQDGHTPDLPLQLQGSQEAVLLDHRDVRERGLGIVGGRVIRVVAARPAARDGSVFAGVRLSHHLKAHPPAVGEAVATVPHCLVGLPPHLGPHAPDRPHVRARSAITGRLEAAAPLLGVMGMPSSLGCGIPAAKARLLPGRL